MTDYSQHGESSYLETLFPENYIGNAIEVGAYNGINGSNTFLFEKKGWKCLCIEPIPEEYEKCKKIRSMTLQYAVSSENKEDVEFTIFTLKGNNKSAISSLIPDKRLIVSHIHLLENTQNIKVKCKTLTSILDEQNFPREIDIVSIDTENTELDVLKGFDLEKYKVKVFVIENNYDEPFCEKYLSKYGYKKIHRLAVNDFYLLSEYYDKFHGEIQDGKYVDETLREYFPDKTYKGVFFDIGAFEPIRISNSYHFEKNGWDVFCFEANPSLIPFLKKERKNVFNYAISNTNKESVDFHEVFTNNFTASYSAIDLSDDYKKKFGWSGNEIITKYFVKQKTINKIIEDEISHIKNIDIISIDIEGGELNCLYGIDLNKYKPKVIVVENAIDSLCQLIKNYLESFNYILDKKISYNEYYVLKDI